MLHAPWKKRWWKENDRDTSLRRDTFNGRPRVHVGKLWNYLGMFSCNFDLWSSVRRGSGFRRGKGSWQKVDRTSLKINEPIVCSPASQAAGIINDSAFVVLRLPLETRVFASGRILGEAEGRIWKFARLRSRPDSARHRLITCGACRARLHIYSIGPRIDRGSRETVEKESREDSLVDFSHQSWKRLGSALEASSRRLRFHIFKSNTARYSRFRVKHSLSDLSSNIEYFSCNFSRRGAPFGFDFTKRRHLKEIRNSSQWTLAPRGPRRLHLRSFQRTIEIIWNWCLRSSGGSHAKSHSNRLGSRASRLRVRGHARG